MHEFKFGRKTETIEAKCLNFGEDEVSDVIELFPSGSEVFQLKTIDLKLHLLRTKFCAEYNSPPSYRILAIRGWIAYNTCSIVSENDRR